MIIEFIKRRLADKKHELLSTLNFYRFNPSRIPGIVQLLCKMGRHDFEADDVLYNDYCRIVGAKLKCFYCFHERGSFFPKSK